MYVVAGVTGHTGRAAAETLIGNQQMLRVLVRDAKQGEPWKARGAEVAVASLADAAQLTVALTGAQGAYLLLPPRYDADDLLAAHRAMVEAMSQAVRKSALPHLVMLSSVGAELADGTGPVRSLHHAEVTLAKAAKNVTFLRPGYYFENFIPVLPAAQGGVLPTFLAPGKHIPMSATADVGRIAAECLLEPATGTRVVEIAHSPDHAVEDIAAVLGDILGRTVTLQPDPLDQVVPTFTSMGMAKGTAELFREMIIALNTGRMRHQGPPALRRFGQLGPADVLRGLLATAPTHA
jgi:uncharacterized protein YbjT (DUF2867 family)